MKKWSTRMLAEAGVMIALSVLLSRIKLYKAPMGGSVTAGSMIPIVFFAMRWGVGPGMVTGGIFGLLKLLLGGDVYSPIQAILEYPIAFALLGFAGIINMNSGEFKIKDYLNIALGVLLAIGGRFLCHFAAGIIFFGQYAPEEIGAVKYSFLYQLQYLLPEFIITAIILSLIWKPINKSIGITEGR